MYKKRYKTDVASSISSGIPHQKRGQVTIFIILGILIVLVLVLVITLRKEIAIFKPEEVLPLEKGPVETLVSRCIESIGDEGLIKMGLQGGYITVPNEISADASLHLRTSPFTVIPYWLYGQNTNIPSLLEMKQELDSYIEEHLRSCVYSVVEAQKTYTFVEKGEIIADTEITENKVLFNVRWDVEILDETGKIISEVLDHVAESSIKLKKVHDTARRIIEYELRDLKLEDLTQDLIAVEHPKIPVTGMEVGCQEKEWAIADVKETLKNMLRVNIRELKAKGTDYVEFPESLPYYQSHYLWDLGDDFLQPNIAVYFNFEDTYPFSFDVRPRSGSSLKSSRLAAESELLPFICIQNWKFVYDVSYPVVVEVRDETTDYSFRMAFTVHLSRNIPDRSGTLSPATTFVIDQVGDQEFCAEARVPMAFSTYTRVDNNEGVSFTDVVDDIDLTFTCLRYKCEIGKTEYDFAGMGDIAAYRTNVPYCVGGIVRAEKEGYKGDWKRVVTEPDAQVELELTPLFSFPAQKISVLKHELTGPQNVGVGEKLTKNEIAQISLTFYKDNEPFQKINAVSSASLDELVSAQQKLEFLAEADFTYTVDVTLLDNAEFRGGYKGNWTVSWDELSTANEMVFHVLSTPEKASEEEVFEFMLGLEENSIRVPLPELR